MIAGVHIDANIWRGVTRGFDSHVLFILCNVRGVN